MWNTNCFEPCISGDIRRYKHLFKGINPNPDDEESELVYGFMESYGNP